MDVSQLLPTPSMFERFLVSAPNDVVDAFFARWPVDLIFRLRVLSSTTFLAVEAYRIRTWSPVSILKPFFKDVRSFLITLDKCDGVVSGSQVVQLLQRHSFPDTESDLDVFLPRHGLMRMGQWMKRHGYRYQATGHKHTLFDVEAIRLASVAIGVNSDGTDAYPCSREASHFATFHFTRRVVTPTPSGYTSRDYLIQLVVVEPDPVPYIISNFHSTGVMNWFTGKKLVSLFPRSTFVHRMSYATQSMSGPDKEWVNKYRRRGFEVVVEGGVPSRESDELEEWTRHVGDAYTWVMPFSHSDCRFLLPYGLARRSTGGYHPPPTRFEVIPHGYGVAPPGAFLRVSVPFVYSALAFVSHGVDMTGMFLTSETAKVFFW